jgi:tetratricopeptide (TPR) repeat protein
VPLIASWSDRRWGFEMNSLVTPIARGLRLRPQPVGIFDPPVSFLLLPDRADRSAADQLMSGDEHAPLQDEWRFYRRALQGRIEEAADLLATDPTPLGQYNRFVLAPSPESYSTLRAALPGSMEPLLDAVAYASGLIETAPCLEDCLAAGLDGELLALVLSVTASHEIESGHLDAAAAVLEQAIEAVRSISPLFAAHLLYQLALLEWDNSAQIALTRFREAIQLAGDTPLTGLRSELWLHLGMLLQGMANGRRELLMEAVKAYQQAFRSGLTAESNAEAYALAHNNLALAYLAMPMCDTSDRLRMGIAVQSLREALRFYSRDTHPEKWSAAQLNLANALQYLPSSHPEENLVQAVELYEEVLAVRNRAIDPVGYARVLANQGNALAHLGLFAPALEKINEAHKLFHWHNEPEMAAALLETVARVNERIGASAAGST